ncbi:MAG: acyl-CoA dehydrogenase family protein [Alphaproteobacteria bacterium]|nr:acyl-CoA dehydrogenase family protein [Alphaproteobacteria bacterium]MBL7097281.1 acyl-CoA dehydrogenase family protein [Alphaproteobacteria bacterium]
MSLAAKAEAIPTEEELLERARRLLPALRERAPACEEKRSLLDETVRDFTEAGFYRILQPKAYGGFEMHPLVLFKVAMEIAKGCPSSGWCLCLIAVHNWEVALLDPGAAKDLWGKDPSTRISSSYAPFGKVERVEGGFRVSGRWPFSSGSNHCQWVFLGGTIRDPSGMPDARVFLIPRPDYLVEDTWHVLGLKGTGSNDIVVRDAFVPEYRTHKFIDSYLGQDVGLKTFTSPNYRYPFGVVFAYCLSVVTLGMADGALEAFTEQMQERLGAYDGAKAAEDPFIRRRAAEADAIVRGLHQRLEANFARMDQHVNAGEPIPLDERVDNKWDAQFMAQEAMRAIELLFKASGGRGIRLSNPLQRYFRDVHAASNHAFLNADKGSLNAGSVVMGGQNSDFAV